MMVFGHFHFTRPFSLLLVHAGCLPWWWLVPLLAIYVLATFRAATRRTDWQTVPRRGGVFRAKCESPPVSPPEERKGRSRQVDCPLVGESVSQDEPNGNEFLPTASTLFTRATRVREGLLHLGQIGSFPNLRWEKLSATTAYRGVVHLSHLSSCN